MILHITKESDWSKAKLEGIYNHISLKSDGFIHCSTPKQVVEIANLLYKEQDDLVLLCIDPERLTAEVVYEDLYETGKLYPHIYGNINFDSVIDVVSFKPNKDGLFILPSVFLQPLQEYNNDNTKMEHVLVVGGTGMLRDVSIHLNKHGHHTSVIGRTDQNLENLKDSLVYQDNFTPLALDYRNDENLKTSLNKIQHRYGPIKKVISWISTTSPNALKLIIEEVEKWNKDKPWSLFHVLGSRSKLEEVKAKVAPPHNCEYRQIKLGFVIEDRSSRWLTNEEISQGVINAIERNDLTTIVGTLDPWEKRP